jgi:hypothetical protein
MLKGHIQIINERQWMSRLGHNQVQEQSSIDGLMFVAQDVPWKDSLVVQK